MKTHLNNQHQRNIIVPSLSCVWGGAFLLLFIVCPSPALCQEKLEVPSVATPNGEFPALFEQNRVAIKECYDLSSHDRNNISTRLSSLEKKLETSSPTYADFENVGAIYADAWKLEYLGKQLIARKEPAGANVVSRAKEYRKRVDRLKSFCEKQTLFKKWYPKMRARIPSAIENQNLAQKLSRNSNLVIAEKNYIKEYVNQQKSHYWLPFAESTKILSPMTDFGHKIMGIVEPKRKAEAEALARKALDESVVDDAKFRAQLANVVAAIGNTGKGDWEGGAVTGPQAINQIGDSWEKARVSAVRNATMAMHFPNLPQPATGQFKDLTADVIRQLGTLVEHDGRRVSAQDAPALYQEYLNALNIWQSRFGETLTSAIEPGLQTLADKEPVFGQKVQNYKYIANDILRWRARIASLRSNNARTNAQSIEEIIRDTATPVQGTYIGLAPLNPDVKKLALAGSSTQFLLEVPQRFNKAPVFLTDLNCVAFGQQRMAIQPYRQRYYARAKFGPEILVAATTQLRAAIDPYAGQDVLSLKMATALSETSQGNLAALGGKISGYGIESIVSRFAKLPDGARPLLGPGPLAPGEFTARSTPVLVLLDLEPAWLQGEYYFVEVN